MAMVAKQQRPMVVLVFAALAALSSTPPAVLAAPHHRPDHADTQSKMPAAVLPDAFLGLWRGTPTGSLLGPWANNMTFHFSRASNGDYLLEDNTDWTGSETLGGWQRFYIEGSGPTAGSLWYCGALLHYFDTEMPTGGNRTAFKNLYKPLGVWPPAPNATQLQYCLATDTPTGRGAHQALEPWPLNVGETACSSCSCSQWTMQLHDNNTKLRSTMTMAGAVHFDVIFDRIGPPTLVNISMPAHGSNFSCAFQPGGRDHGPIDNTSFTRPSSRLDASGCPMAHLWRKRTTNPKHGIKGTGSYDHCYVLNQPTGYRLEWSVDLKKSLLHVLVSAAAKTSNDWISIGFRPLSWAPTGNATNQVAPEYGTGINRLFGMQGADIVLGGTTSGVKTYYASAFVGAIDEDKSLNVTNASVTFANGQITLAFTRPLVGGYLLANHNIAASIIASPPADFLWAIGQFYPGDPQPGYHGMNRGMRAIDWLRPERDEDPLHRC